MFSSWWNYNTTSDSTNTSSELSLTTGSIANQNTNNVLNTTSTSSTVTLPTTVTSTTPITVTPPTSVTSTLPTTATSTTPIIETLVKSESKETHETSLPSTAASVIVREEFIQQILQKLNDLEKLAQQCPLTNNLFINKNESLDYDSKTFIDIIKTYLNCLESIPKDLETRKYFFLGLLYYLNDSVTNLNLDKFRFFLECVSKKLEEPTFMECKILDGIREKVQETIKNKLKSNQENE